MYEKWREQWQLNIQAPHWLMLPKYLELDLAFVTGKMTKEDYELALTEAKEAEKNGVDLDQYMSTIYGDFL